MSYNIISNIDILKNINFKNLQELNLRNNKISDLGALGNIKADKLEKLDLSGNNISDIIILENEIFKNLREL